MKNYNSVGTNLDERLKHFYYAKNAKIGIVEIGVLNGETSQIFCDANKNISIVGIDPIVPDSMDSNLIGSIQKIKDLELKYSNYKFINDFSYNIVKNWSSPIDYLFIDGDHNYNAVKNPFG